MVLEAFSLDTECFAPGKRRVFGIPETQDWKPWVSGKLEAFSLGSK